MRKHIIHILLAVLVLLPAASCNKWLDIKPDSEQTMDEFWANKEEAEAVLMGTYQQLRSSLVKFVQWGDIRSDMVALGPGMSSNDDMLAIKSVSIRPDNTVCAWQTIYNAILRANCVIESAPEVLKVDNTFKEKDCNAWVAEAKFIRTLCYFYLVRTFRDVPYVDFAYTSDNIKFEMEKTDGMTILANIRKDLESCMDDLPVSYAPGSWMNKGRATAWAAYALLADICLWLADYDATCSYCQILENSKLFYLLEKEKWYELYYPGNSDESIFELQWDSNFDQTNSLYGWFYNDNDSNNYAASESALVKFDDYDSAETDVRAEGGSYVSSTVSGASTHKVWKYAGTDVGGTSTRESKNRDANWIFYRFADILLMHAEALVMKGQFEEAYEYVIEIRERAGCETHPDPVEDESAALDMVLDERAREFCFEGKRWFDLVRVATLQNGKYKEKLISLLLLDVAAKDRPLMQSKLQNTYAYFFPINEDDIDASGGLLIQNPYYK